MARKRHRAVEIVAKLRQVDVLTSQGRPVVNAGMTPQILSSWSQLSDLQRRVQSPGMPQSSRTYPLRREKRMSA